MNCRKEKTVAARLTTEGKPGVVTGATFDAWNPGPGLPAHPRRGEGPLRDRVAGSPRPSRSRAKTRQPAGGTTRGPRPGNFPLPWPGGRGRRLGDIVAYQLSASLAVLDHAASHRDYWLRTALGVARRAVEQRDPFAFVVPATQRDPLAAARLLEVYERRRRGGAPGQEPSRRRRPDLERREPRHLDAAAGERVRPHPAAEAALPRPALGAGRRAPTPLRRHRPHAAAAARGSASRASPPRSRRSSSAWRCRWWPRGGSRVRARSWPWLTRAEILLRWECLLAAGVEVRWALEPFSEGDRSFEAGALLVPSSARARLEKLVFELGILGRATRARPRSLRLRTPRVGLYRSWGALHGRGVDPLRVRAGDERGLPQPPRPRGAWRWAPGSLRRDRPARRGRGHPPRRPRAGIAARGVHGRPGAKGVAALADFVERGGTLVALDSAAGLVIRQMDLPVRDVLAEVDPGEFFCPGSILRVRTDPSRPLVHGLPEALPIWFQSSPAFEADASAVAARYTDDDPLLSPAGSWEASASRGGPPSWRSSGERAGWSSSVPTAVPRPEPGDLRRTSERALPLLRTGVRRVVFRGGLG